MKLVAYSAQPAKIDLLRDLTEDEVRQHRKYTPVSTEARERLKLFRILAHNYEEWRKYLDSLLSAQPVRSDDESLHLDRLLLNYLTCAYTIRQHFEVSLRKRFRKDAVKLQGYEDFLDRLCSGSWPTAFFFDFRGFVQHRGLGIGHYNRELTRTSVTLTVTCEASELVASSREWDRSKLTAAKGTLELVELLEEFNFQMLHSYGTFVAKMFFPELSPAAEFYDRLTKEVQEKHPGLRMVFSEGDIQTKEKEGREHFAFSFFLVPNDLFGELDISLPQKL